MFVVVFPDFPSVAELHGFDPECGVWLWLCYDILMEEYINKMPWAIIIIFCLTLGLAPYKPPHIVEKITMLVQGRLVRPIDWFDLFFHSIPWILLVLKMIYIRK